MISAKRSRRGHIQSISINVLVPLSHSTITRARFHRWPIKFLTANWRRCSICMSFLVTGSVHNDWFILRILILVDYFIAIHCPGCDFLCILKCPSKYAEQFRSRHNQGTAPGNFAHFFRFDLIYCSPSQVDTIICNWSTCQGLWTKKYTNPLRIAYWDKTK